MFKRLLRLAIMVPKQKSSSKIPLLTQIQSKLKTKAVKKTLLEMKNRSVVKS